jgi:RHS repeat-associated protein
MDGPFDQIATTQSTYSTYLDTSVTSGILYYYRIQRVPGDGSAACLSDPLAAMAPVGRTQMAIVPDVINLPQAAAEIAITDASLTVGTIVRANSNTVPAGNVISQDPPPDSVVLPGFAVNLVMSLGPVMVSVPDVVGQPQAAAEASIIAASLSVGAITTANSDTVPAGSVISQNPVGGVSVAEGSSVDLVVSLGPVMVSVPNVVGLPQANAEAAITAASLSVGTVTTANSDTVAAGNVISQNPVGGFSVAEGSPVDLVVSLGPVMVSVPDVVGQPQADAEAAIIAASLSVGAITTANSDTVPAGSVISQDPVGGTSVAEGSSVNLVVSLGPALVAVPDVVGLSEAAAQAAIGAAGLAVGTSTTANSDTVPAGDVISQDPVGGTLVLPATPVDIVVSLGPVVTDDFIRPEVSVIASPAAANTGDVVTITVNATDNVAVASKSLTVNGTAVPLDGSGTATYSSAAPGVFTAVATAQDAAGNEGSASQEFRFLEPGDITPPTVAFSSPADEAALSVPTDIIGTANDANLTRYTLEYSVKDRGDYVVFGGGTSPVIGGVLDQLDPTTLRNGLYDIRLTAEDASGNTASIKRTYQLEGEMKVGNFTISFNDLTIPMAGIPITVTRTYDSRVKSKGDFGVGWTLDLKTIEVQENRVPGEGWETFCKRSIFGTCLEWGVRPAVSHSVLVTFRDGRDHEFDVRANTTFAQPSGLAQGDLDFPPQPGTSSSLQAIDSTTYDFLLGGELLDSGFTLINPNRYRLTDADGLVFVCNQSTGLEQITDPNGNTIAFQPNGIIHSAGKSVTFTRDAQNRITLITDPMGNTIEFEYDFYGDLVSVTDQEGNTTRFTYNSSHGLVDIIDPRGITPARNEYDDDGRLVAVVDADGNRVEFSHNVGARQEVIEDRLGNITVFEYDEDGNVLVKTDALGNTTTYTYDANGNKLTETDPLGNTTTYTYDSRDNKLTETDPLGNTTTMTYNSRNQILTETDPLGNTTANTYDANGNLVTVTDPLGNTTTHTYDASGNQLSTANCFGTTSHTYDAFGNKISETDPLGNVTTYTYDSNGNQLTETRTRASSTGPVVMTITKVYDSLNQLIETIDPDGNSEVIEYNSVRKRSALVDKNGNRTEFLYDAAGNLSRTTYPDGTIESNTYDAEGNRLSSTNRGGRTTQYEYDALNRLISTTHPDGSAISLEYDAAGRVIQNTDENGNQTHFEYDANGQQTKIINALSNETIFAYDATGNKTSMTDANGNTTSYDYDALGRKTQTNYHDGTVSQVAYEGCSQDRKSAETDQAGNTTQFEYDALASLTKVINALGGETTYTYDEVGNRLTQTDANGNTTAWTYDNLGRVITHTLPLGETQSYIYDAVGNQISKTDFNGDTISYTYDVNNRLTSINYPASIIYPDGSEVAYTYTAMGNRESVTDERGGVTSYSYTVRDLPAEVVQPDGSAVSYTYDAKGNRTSVTSASGNTAYTYDALNRLASVADPDGGVTSYTYDSVGNRAGVTYPNGSAAGYTYDSLNRLTYLENARSDLTLISSYTYTLGPAGNRLSVAENGGRTVDYTYDALYRLVEEDITDALLGNETISYTYDPVANRLTKVDSGGTTTYTYDANDRLLTEGGNTYTYDNNGNTLSKTVGGNTTSYTYDFENRLISVLTPGSLIDYTYDADGIRLSAEVDGVATDYLVDKNRRYAQVLEEKDGAGNLVVSYVYGDDLISQNRSGQYRYYMYDGSGSARQLTDSIEATTDTYVFDAFGIELDRTGTTENNYLYTGEQYDPNVGFYYLRARYYDMQTGRFMVQDPFEGNPFEPHSLHKYLYANANPVMFVDPSGEMSIMNVMVSIAIVGILASIAYAGLSHLISMHHTPVDWEGILMYGGGGGAGWGVLGFVAILESKCYMGKKAKGVYAMAAAGGVLAPPWLPISEGVALISLITPGIFGAKSWTLVGPFSWISATAAWGVGPSWTAMYMGMGIGEIGLIPGAAFGIDIGLDALGGVSIPIYLGPQTDC